jgi:apolipoprotein N-acyltransferase
MSIKQTQPLVTAWWGLLIAAISGGVMWLAFPPIGFGPFAAAAVGLLTLTQYRVSILRGFLTGLAAGVVFFLLLLSWMQVIGSDAWIALALFCASWFALMGIGTAVMTRLPLWPVWVACLWVLQELLRGSIPFGGFPWGRLAFGQPDSQFGRIAALFGQPGVTWTVALLGTAIVGAVVAGRARRRGAAISWSVLAVVLAVAPTMIPLAVEGDTVGGNESAIVAIVQGGTPQTGMGAMDVRRAVLDNHVRETIALSKAVAAGTQPQPDFVLWPENSTDINPFVDPDAAALISLAAREVKAPIIVGAIVDVPDNPAGVWNLGVVWDPVTGPGDRYIKTHPVPFGEYIPFRSQLSSLIGRFDRIPRDFIPGDRPGLFDIAGIRLGDVICFEVAYDDVVSAVMDGDARLITVQTNNATYSGSAQPAQQLAIERMRAIETGRTVAVAATSGISAMIRSDGVVTAQMNEDETGSISMPVALRGTHTLAGRLEGLPGNLLSVIAIGALVAGAVIGTRQHRRESAVDDVTG